MERVLYIARSQGNIRFLNEAVNLGVINTEKLMKSMVETYGAVSKRETDGTLSTDLKVVKATDTSLTLFAGYAIVNLEGEVLILEVDQDDIDVSSHSDNIEYYVYIVPSKSSFESGTLTFTNGSKNVSVTGGNFDKLNPGESLVITTSLSGNDGVYPVGSIAGSNLLLLTDDFAGTTEAGLKWKIAPYFGPDLVATTTDLVYFYDSYEVVISSSEIKNGVKLASFRKASGAVSVVTDKREENLYRQKPVFKLIADEITKGKKNDITSIEEKAAAGAVRGTNSDFFTKGIWTGGAMSFNSSNQNNELLDVEPLVVYDGLGRRVQLTQTVQINLRTAVNEGSITEGDNYLYIIYKSPNSYQFAWDDSPESEKADRVLLKGVRYASDILPYFSFLTTVPDRCKLRANSIVFDGKENPNYAEGQCYYSGGKLYVWIPGSQEEGDKAGTIQRVQIIDALSLQNTIETEINKIAKREILRFSLYIGADKDAWFFHNSIQMPTFIPYTFTVTGVKVGSIVTTTPVPSTYQGYDYLNSNSLYVKKDSLVANVTNKTSGLPTKIGANGTLGIAHRSTGGVEGNPRKIVLSVNGAEVDIVSSESLPNGLYEATVEVISTDPIVVVPTPVTQNID